MCTAVGEYSVDIRAGKLFRHHRIIDPSDRGAGDVSKVLNIKNGYVQDVLQEITAYDHSSGRSTKRRAESLRVIYHYLIYMY